MANPGGFGGAANNVNTMNAAAIEGYLNNLANATTNSNTKMTTLIAQMQAITARLDNMPAIGAPANVTPPPATSTPAPATSNCSTRRSAHVFTQAQALARFNITGYCSTHGYWVGAKHTSKNVYASGTEPQ